MFCLISRKRIFPLLRDVNPHSDDLDPNGNMRFTVKRYDSVPCGDREEIDVRIKTPRPGSTTPRPASCQELRLLPEERATSRRASENDVCPNTSSKVRYDSGLHKISSFPSISSQLSGSAGQHDMYEPVALRGREFAKRQRQRLVHKEGELNISNTKVDQKKQKYLIDIFTTMLETKWRYNLLIFGMGFVISWLFFAFIWWVIMYAHGDHLHLPDDDPDWKPCVANVHDFQTALLFSIETQHTIGYGSRMAEANCTESIVLLMIQSVFGVFIQCLMTGMIFAKLSRPKRRAATLVFSKNAVICQRDGELCLLFRVGDMRKSHIVQTIIRAVMVRNKLTKEGEHIPLCQFPLELETETCNSTSDSFVFLAWPVTITHRINEKSPLWEISAEQLLSERFEIVVIFEGTVESTGMTTQVRTSYLPSEILWGHSMAPLMTFQKENGQYKIDYTQFHNTIPVNTPEISAKDLAVCRKKMGAEAYDHGYPGNFTCPAIMPKATPLNMFKRFRTSLKRKMSNRRRRGGGVNCELPDSRSGSLGGSCQDVDSKISPRTGRSSQNGSIQKESTDSGCDVTTPTAN